MGTLNYGPATARSGFQLLIFLAIDLRKIKEVENDNWNPEHVDLECLEHHPRNNLRSGGYPIGNLDKVVVE